MIVPPIGFGENRSRRSSFRERRELRRVADRSLLPALAGLQGRRLRVEAPDQGSCFFGRLVSARRLQLCIELVLADVEIRGRLQLVQSYRCGLTVMRTIDDIVVSQDGVLSKTGVLTVSA